MKKIILSVLLVAAFATFSFAQFGLKAGVNMANQSYESQGISISPSSKIGFVFGVNYKLGLAESLSLRPGVQLSTKGSKFDFGGTDLSVNFNYLEVPIDFVYSSGSLSVHAGPYLGFLMSAKSDGEDVKDMAKSSDFGVNLGLGYSFGQIGVGANYGLGLSNINDDGTDGTIKNNVISLYLTYSL